MIILTTIVIRLVAKNPLSEQVGDVGDRGYEPLQEPAHEGVDYDTFTKYDSSEHGYHTDITARCAKSGDDGKLRGQRCKDRHKKELELNVQRTCRLSCFDTCHSLACSLHRM